MFVVCAGATVAAQDRVILFDTWLAGPLLNWHAAIRQIEITDGGRRWQLVRSLELPPHIPSSGPVALADGSRILWLASDGIASSPIALVQYELRTGLASFVDIGPLHRGFLLADKKKARVYIVGEDRITFIDERLRPETMFLSEARGISDVAITDDCLVLHRLSSASSNQGQLVFVDLETRRAVRTIPFPQYAFDWRVSRDGQRVYSTYKNVLAGFVALELSSGVTGELLKRVILDFPGIHDLLDLDEPHNVIVHDNSGGVLVLRDATTLAVIGELGPGVFHGSNNRGRAWYGVEQTANEKAILILSHSPLFSCQSARPRIDIFDGTTLRHVSRIDGMGTCPHMLAVPPR